MLGPLVAVMLIGCTGTGWAGGERADGDEYGREDGAKGRRRGEGSENEVRRVGGRHGEGKAGWRRTRTIERVEGGGGDESGEG